MIVVIAKSKAMRKFLMEIYQSLKDDVQYLEKHPVSNDLMPEIRVTQYTKRITRCNLEIEMALKALLCKKDVGNHINLYAIANIWYELCMLNTFRDDAAYLRNAF